MTVTNEQWGGARRSWRTRVSAQMLGEAGGGIEGHEVPFGFAQGRLSTAFAWRLTSLRMTKFYSQVSVQRTDANLGHRVEFDPVGPALGQRASEDFDEGDVGASAEIL